MVNVLVPKVLDARRIATVVQEPVGTDVPDNGEIHIVALRDLCRIVGSHFGAVVPIDEKHLTTTMDHRGVLVRIFPTGLDGTDAKFGIDVFGGARSGWSSMDTPLVPPIHALPVLVQTVRSLTF